MSWLLHLKSALVVCLFFISAAAANEQIVRFDDGAGGQMWYRINFPENYDPNVSYPLTMFLHGRGPNTVKPVVDLERDVETPPPGLSTALASAPYESILISPQLEQGNWRTHDNDRLIREALADVEATYGTDPNRRYVTGLSFGGFGTFHFLQEFPGEFAAGAPLAGYYNPEFVPGEPFPANPLAEYAEVVKDTPTWVFHGTRDTAVSVDASRAVVDALINAGGNVRYTELPNGVHNIWTQLYTESDFPTTAILTLDVDTASNTFQVFAEVEDEGNRGIQGYLFALTGADTLTHLSPKSDFSPVTGTSLGFANFRTADDDFVLRAQQPGLPSDPKLIAGFGQISGVLPGAGQGTGEVQAEYDAPLLLAEGTFSDLSMLDFDLADIRGRVLPPTVKVIPEDGGLYPAAATALRLVHDGQTIYSTGDHQEFYPWLFSQSLVPEPSSLAILSVALLALSCGRIRT